MNSHHPDSVRQAGYDSNYNFEHFEMYLHTINFAKIIIHLSTKNRLKK